LAAKRFAGIEAYSARLRRREQIKGKDHPEEVIRVLFRKHPWSVHLKFLGPVAKGREVVYVKGQYDDKLHTRLASGDSPFMPGGSKISLAPDSPLVRASSRHSITEAGIGSLIDQFGKLLDAVRRGTQPPESVKYLGPQKRPEFPNPVETVEQVIPPKFESALPEGGKRAWYFDPALRLPVLVITRDPKNHAVEYYCYDEFRTEVKLGDDDFNPAKMGQTSN
jgi:hypothetical protein